MSHLYGRGPGRDFPFGTPFGGGRGAWGGFGRGGPRSPWGARGRGGPWGGPRGGSWGGPRGGSWGGFWGGSQAGPWSGSWDGPWGGAWGGTWGGAWGAPATARKGDLRDAILALLAEEPRTGYQIIQELGERSGGTWRPSPGAVYPALQQLADEGLISGEESGGQRPYHLTDQGRAYVEENAARLDEPWAETTASYEEGVPDLFDQAAQTRAAAMQILQSGAAEQVERATAVLSAARRDLYRILAADDAADERGDEAGPTAGNTGE